eukprot:8566416-Pyramimonas_sp.AAC.1
MANDHHTACHITITMQTAHRHSRRDQQKRQNRVTGPYRYSEVFTESVIESGLTITQSRASADQSHTGDSAPPF